jgi:hypothetical protein
MRSLMYFNVLAMLALVSAAAVASAQLAPVPPLSPSETLPPPQVVPGLPPPVALPIRPMTVSEFVASFKPLPGNYEVMLIHPKTCCPVKVCFTLPPGCLRKVRCTGHKIVFDYKCQRDVVIRFLHSGKVRVRGC